MKKSNLTKKEIQVITNRFEAYVADRNSSINDLKALGKDPDEVLKQIGEGVDAFYNFYQTDVNEESIKAKIKEATKDMDDMKKYSYYANLMTAITNVGAQTFGVEEVERKIEDYKNAMTAIELGIVDESELNIAENIKEMEEIISENIEALSVVFIDVPGFSKLQEECISGDTESVKAVALNSRELAIDMATAVYVTQEKDELTSLGETKYSPRDVGVVAATMLEIDAAQKSGSAEKAKEVLLKASKVAGTLIVISPTVLINAFMLTACLLTMPTIVAPVITTATVINLVVSGAVTHKFLAPAYAKGAKLLETTIDKVKPMYNKLSSWIQETVLPAVFPRWTKCYNFAVKKVITPAFAFVMKTKNTLIAAADKIEEKARALFGIVKVKVQDIIDSAKNLVNPDNIEAETSDEAFEEAVEETEETAVVEDEEMYDEEEDVDEEEDEEVDEEDA